MSRTKNEGNIEFRTIGHTSFCHISTDPKDTEISTIYPVNKTALTRFDHLRTKGYKPNARNAEDECSTKQPIIRAHPDKAVGDDCKGSWAGLLDYV